MLNCIMSYEDHLGGETARQPRPSCMPFELRGLLTLETLTTRRAACSAMLVEPTCTLAVRSGMALPILQQEVGLQIVTLVYSSKVTLLYRLELDDL